MKRFILPSLGVIVFGWGLVTISLAAAPKDWRAMILVPAYLYSIFEFPVYIRKQLKEMVDAAIEIAREEENDGN